MHSSRASSFVGAAIRTRGPRFKSQLKTHEKRINEFARVQEKDSEKVRAKMQAKSENTRRWWQNFKTCKTTVLRNCGKIHKNEKRILRQRPEKMKRSSDVSLESEGLKGLIPKRVEERKIRRA
ncbi:hypothetical protein X777_02602 [Ooceraea biroi]|uniref:Uncharacterized protein n=1 Tax=Ooceraea biroi TaxID=2015173 RepID=A0A026WNU4_OOCBI|nr:hypothetical protein X777_02602 [Ooceraea biroi]